MNRFSRLGMGTAVFLMFSSLAFSVLANQLVISVVYPTGIFPADVQNVQAAVDQGGVVILKAFNTKRVPTAFNFSTDFATASQSGSINLTTNVTIIGERIGKYHATILGGYSPILGQLPVKSTIQGLDFESPFNAAISIFASTGSDVFDNSIHNVLPVLVQVPSGRIISFGDGIDFLGESDTTAITGRVRVLGNKIEGLGAIFSNGIQFDTVSADVEISGNTITGVNSAVTEQGGGITLIRLENTTVVSGNQVIPGNSASSAADGIFIDGDFAARYRVFANRVRCDGPNGDGIDIVGGDPTGTTGTINAIVADNDITVVNGTNAAGIIAFDLVTDTLIAGNVLHGNGAIALGVTTYGFKTDVASVNRFIDNRIEGFTSSLADVFYDANARYNLEIGKCGSLLDLGVGNSSTCDGSSALATPSMSVTITPEATTATMNGKLQQRILLQSAMQHVRRGRQSPVE